MSWLLERVGCHSQWCRMRYGLAQRIGQDFGCSGILLRRAFVVSTCRSFACAVASFALLLSPVDKPARYGALRTISVFHVLRPVPLFFRSPTTVIVGLPEEVLNSPMGGMLRPLLEQMTTQVRAAVCVTRCLSISYSTDALLFTGYSEACFFPAC